MGYVQAILYSMGTSAWGRVLDGSQLSFLGALLGFLRGNIMTV